jgi:hypothetical protein
LDTYSSRLSCANRQNLFASRISPPSFQFLLSLLLMPGLNPSHSSLSLLYGIKLLYGKELSC